MAQRKLNRTPSSEQAAAAAASASTVPPVALAESMPLFNLAVKDGDICHISQRYPGMQGRVLQDQVFNDWTIPRCEPMSSPWYVTGGSADRERALVRSSTNKARSMNQTTLIEYSDKCKSDGLLRGLGSELWAMPSDVVIQIGKTVFFLLTGGTRVEAVYLAHSEAPHHPSVMSTIQGGSPKMVLFKLDTPADVQEYLRDIGNALNDFSVSSTWVESLSLVPTVTTLFEAEKKRREAEGMESWSMKALTEAAKAAKLQGLQADGYEATYFKFADALYPKRWSGPTSFKDCRFVASKLQAISGSTELYSWASQSVIWTDKRLVASLVFAALAEAFKVFESTCPDLIAHATLLARFAMPNKGELASPFLIKDKGDMHLLGKSLMVLGDDRKMVKQAGYAPMFFPRADTATGTAAPKRLTLLMDELVRIMNGCLSGVADSDIDFVLYDKMLMAGFCLSMKGSVTMYVNSRLRQRTSVIFAFEQVKDVKATPAAPATTPTAAPPVKAKKAKKAPARKRKVGIGSAAATGSSTAAPVGGFDEDAVAGADAAADGSESECDEYVPDQKPDGLRTIIKTPLQLLNFVHSLICKVHKVDKGDYIIAEEADAEKKDQPQAADTGASVEDEHESASLVAFLTAQEANKHTKVSAAIVSFMRQHPMVVPEVMPLAHATLAAARAAISQRMVAGDLSQLVNAGDALTPSSEGEVILGMCHVWHVPSSYVFVPMQRVGVCRPRQCAHVSVLCLLCNVML